MVGGRIVRILMGALAAATTAVVVPAHPAAHEIPVHELITNLAIDHLIAQNPNLRACGALPIREVFNDAVEAEDAATTFPNGYYMFHFMPRLNDTVNNLPQTKAFATCTSTQWGLLPDNSKVCSQNILLDLSAAASSIATYQNAYTFDAAGVDMLKAVPDDALKKRGLAKLGHLVHLLQDMTQPAHVLNDAHPHPPYWLLAPLGDPSAFEVMTGTREDVPRPYPDVPPIQDELEAFTRLQSYVSQNFLSEKAVLQLDPLTTPTNQDGYYINGAGPQAWQKAPGMPFSISEDVADAQFDRLAPLAVAYTAALIKWVHEHRAPVCEETLQVEVTGAGRVQSSPDGARLPGEDALSCQAGAACAHSFPSGLTVTLTAVPSAGATFLGWAGEGCAGNGPCSVPMDAVAAKRVTATFSPACQNLFPTGGPFPLTILSTGKATITNSTPSGSNTFTVDFSQPQLFQSPQSQASGVLGSAAGVGLFEQCDGVFPSASGSRVDQGGIFRVTTSVTAGGGTLSVQETGDNTSPANDGNCPGTCQFDRIHYVKTWQYDIRTGAYSLSVTSDRSLLGISGQTTTTSVSHSEGTASGVQTLPPPTP